MASPAYKLSNNNSLFHKNLTDSAATDIEIMKNSESRLVRKLQISNELLQKAPFLPRLPDKMFSTFRLNSAHLINNSYIDIEENEMHTHNLRPMLKREKSFIYKGDLLRASQICLVLDSNMSDTFKQIKTADTPWIRSLNTIKTRPYKPIINRNKVEMSRFLSKQNRPNDTTFFHSNPNISQDKSRIRSSPNLRVKKKSNEPILRCMTSIEHKSPKIHQFAEDLLNEHITRSLVNFSSATETKDQPIEFLQPNVAIHALDTVWELHDHVLKASPYLEELYEEQSKLQTSEYKKSLKNSKVYGVEKAERLFHLVLDITDLSINKHSLAVALGNLYHPDKIDVPGKLVAGALAAGNLLKFDALIKGTIEKMSNSLTKKTISECYNVCKKYGHQNAKQTCESWLEINLMSDLASSLIFLKHIPLELITKILKSKMVFVTNEYAHLIIILYWIFFRLNPNEENSPTESVLNTYFSSFPKEKSLVEKYTEFKDILYSARLHGISKSNQIVSIQHMNIYPHSYLVKIMLEVQQSHGHGGDMDIIRNFETGAIRHGFILDIEKQNNYSEIFSLYGFHFELITEKLEDEDNKYKYQFHIQRLTSKNPVLTYEQSQLEMFSLRNDRLCTYSISVQYWNEGKQVSKSTGLKHHVFGIAKSQLSPIFEIEFPFIQSNQDDEIKKKELHVMYSFLFPVD